MTEYIFQEGIPAGFTPDFETGIFHDQRHLQLQSPTEWHSFSLLNEKDRAIIAAVHVHLKEGSAVSPLRSPFGSFVFSKSISPKLLGEFIGFAETKLKGGGAKTLLLKNPPAIYALSEIELLQQVLQRSGYQLKQEEISAIIPIDKNLYEEILHRSKKSRLKKAYDMGLNFQHLSLNHLSEIYDFLKVCREEKSYSLSMTLSELQQVANIFPESFFIHSVTHHGDLVAASISIRVKSLILYAFYYDHMKKYDQVSPVVFLSDGLYSFCQESGIELLDLGTSNVEGKLIEPLLDFKLSLGAQPSCKRTFVKNFF